MNEASIIFYVFAVIFGLIFGSFANVVIYRYPRGMSISYPSRSFCPNCKRFIPLYLNIPVLSWIFLKGKCKFCKWRIPIRYPIVEVLSGLFSLFSTKYGLSVEYFISFFFLWGLLVASFIDIEFMIIPDEISIGGFIIILIYKVISGRLDYFFFVPSFFLLGVALTYKLIKKREGLGMGDVKLMLMIGVFLGFVKSILVILIASILGVILGTIIILLKKRDFKQPIPFGPFLSFSALIIIIFEDKIPLFLPHLP